MESVTRFENMVSGLNSTIGNLNTTIASNMDNTSVVLIATASLTTAAASQSANAVINIAKWSENTVYIESTAAAARANDTGLTVVFETRPASAIGWYVFRTETGVNESGLTAYKIMGSGVEGLSSVTHFGDIRLTIDNISDSGSATVVAWLKSRTPI